VEDDFLLAIVHGNSETRLHQKKTGGRCPGLRRTGHWIKGWALTRATLEPAKKLGQSSQVHGGADVEQGQQNLTRHLPESITRHAAGNQGIVMGPDRTVVIGERIVASLSVGDSPDSPAVKKIRLQHFAGQAGSGFGRSNAGIEALSGIGSAHAAGLFVSIQGQRINRKIIAPECFIKTSLQGLRLMMESA